MATAKDKPVCFIAMAFDHEDTDYLYEKQILPILKRNGIKPIIINRQQSNDDLNIQIIEQLEEANFCITDLTYARQSVYFEAGYAQRTIPVIYTVRKDHLNSGQPDNLRVHFDLQMKPLIVWNSQDDPTFGSRLELRIQKTFLRSWSKTRLEEEKHHKAIEEFNALSLGERLMTMRFEAIKILQKLGVTPSDWFEHAGMGDNYGTYNKPAILDGRINHVSGVQKRGKLANYFSVQSFQSLSKRDLLTLSHKYSPDAIIQHALPEVREYKKPSQNAIHADILVLSLKPAPSQQNAHVFDRFVPLQDPFRYYGEFSEKPYSRNENSIHIKVTFYFLGGIKSQVHLKEQLQMTEQLLAQHLR